MPGYKTVVCVLPLMLIAGCVERTMTLRSNPPGALVTLNGQTVGRTPVTRTFTWYGDYDVEVRQEGYQTLKTHTPVKAPWWQWIPFDLVAEILPLHLTDRHEYSYDLQPASTQPANPEQIMGRAQFMKNLLESGQYTPPRRPATTQATTGPVTSQERSETPSSKPE